ncbi:toxin CptA [Nitrosospira sp. Nsp5]|uniref:Toxin CptA n=1 Tax=Nitrosospira multiformis TaxID=1231 RepID=A0ABY0TD97_9PROT|nr:MULTISPECIES: protein YgfX [Nitrosospira]PTR06209.1 toxin CptA [Nitrosospira sp. Nsp5]SDQ64675.1 toxin CptA [Nitrosospira multiformis]
MATPSSPSPPLLIIRLKPSMRLVMILSLAHFSAIGLLWPLMLPAAAKLIGCIILALSLFFHLKRYALLRSPASVTGLELSDEMTCTLELQCGERIACDVLGSSFVAPYLTVLELKPLKTVDSGESIPSLTSPVLLTPRPPPRMFFGRSVTILPDGIDAEEFRQLRVLLRWKWKDQE